MATIFVFNNNTATLERYTRGPRDPMPYNVGGTLTVREFMGNQPVGWTDLFTMESWNILRSYYGRPILLRFAFATFADDGCLVDPEHYFGTAFVIAPRALSDLEALYAAAHESGAFNTISPIGTTEGNFTVSNRYMPANYFRIETLPPLYRGSRNNYVFGLQSALNLFGENLAVDGIFGPLTDAAVRRFQTARFLTEDGIISRLEWESILGMGCLPW